MKIYCKNFYRRSIGQAYIGCVSDVLCIRERLVSQAREKNCDATNVQWHCFSMGLAYVKSASLLHVFSLLSP